MALFFELFRYAFTTIFGIFVSAAFLSVRMTRQNILFLGLFSVIDLGLQSLLFLFRSVVFISMLYPLLVHLPLLLLFLIVMKKEFVPSVIAITTAYLCCCISSWLTIIAESAGVPGLVADIIYTASLAGTSVIIYLFIREPFSAILKKPAHSLISFGIIPVFYYIFDYISTVYTEWLYSHNPIAVEFLPFLLCICHLVFCTVYFQEYEEKQELVNRSRMVEMKQEQSEKEIAMIRHSEETISLLRHDMRHFLNNISWYIENGDTEKAQEYIHEIIESVDSTASKHYCRNEIVNMILSSYEHIIAEKHIEFHSKLRLPAELPVSDVDITSILSNGMENAIHAVSTPECQKRVIELTMTESNGKLFLSLENTFAVKPLIVDGMPVSRKKDHGFGTQSILYTTEKLKGNCHFALDGDRFLLQIVI